MCKELTYVLSLSCRSDNEWTYGEVQNTAEGQAAPCQLPPFNCSSRPTPQTKQAKTPLAVLQLFLTTAILEIVRQTKLFASQQQVSFIFTVEELLAFIAINIAMGLLKLPQVRDYWSTNEVLATPWFPAIMARDRFFSILRYFHLADSTLQKQKGEIGYDPLYKVRLLLDHLTAVFPVLYQPDRYLSIDEMMIGTRCRVAFLQFLPNKPTRFSIKVFVNSEAKSGYVLNFQVYTGATDRTSSAGVGYRVVMDLLER